MGAVRVLIFHQRYTNKRFKKLLRDFYAGSVCFVNPIIDLFEIFCYGINFGLTRSRHRQGLTGEN